MCCHTHIAVREEKLQKEHNTNVTKEQKMWKEESGFFPYLLPLKGIFYISMLKTDVPHRYRRPDQPQTLAVSFLKLTVYKLDKLLTICVTVVSQAGS